MAAYEIPLTNEAQKFSITLVGVTYNMSVRWNAFSENWNLDIADIDGVPILTSLPLVTGADLLDPYPYLNFGGSLVAQTDGGSLLPPTYENLGANSHLYFVTP